MRGLRPLRLGVMVVGVTVAALGCTPGDTSLYVKNESGQAWYLSVPRESGPNPYLWVVKVAPGADTFALSWYGGASVAVKVLALDCSPVGTFRTGDDRVWVVESIPGLTGRVENHGAPFGSRTTTPGVQDTEDCGGSLAL